ncbi:sialic acid-binding Ig-like lectin 13 [Lissotriton helveticus]
MPHQKHVMPLPPSQLCLALQEHKKPLGMITFGNISFICARPTMACARLLVMSFLWNGVLGAQKDYTLTALEIVTAQEGLCVLIQCEFTTEKPWSAGSPRGYWYFQGATQYSPAVASNDGDKAIRADTRGRFKLVGDVTRRDCSLRIDDVRRWDEGSYYFRYEHSPYSSIKYSYAQFSLRLTVVDLWDQPEISLPRGVMVEGETVTVECTAPGRCSGTAPGITWRPESPFVYHQSSRNTDNADGTRTYRSTIEFTGSRDQNNKRLSCSVYFPAVGASSHRSVWLNIEYPPAAPVIIMYEAEGGKQTPTACSMEMLEGFDYTLVCTVDSNPISKLTWKKSENILEGSVSSSNTLQLTLHNVTSSDDGDYYCVATNKHGSNSSFINAHVEYPPRTPHINAEDATGINLNVTNPHWSGKQENVSNKMIKEGQTLNMHCSVDSSPLASLTWIKGGETKLEKGDITNLTLRLSNVTSKDEGQYWCIAKNKHGLANSSVFISVLEIESPNQPRVAIIGGVVASLVVLAGVCFLAWMMYCRRTKNASIESSDNMEAVGDSTVIYSNINKTPKGLKTENNPCTDASTMDDKEDLYENFRRDIFQYSSIHFSRAKPGSQPIPVPEETLYSEVKVH